MLKQTFNTSNFFKAKEHACLEILRERKEINFDLLKVKERLSIIVNGNDYRNGKRTNVLVNIYKVKMNADCSKLIMVDVLAREYACDDILFYSFDSIMDIILELFS